MYHNPWLIILITITTILPAHAATSTLGKPTNIDAQRVLLYPLNTTTMPNQQFTVTFGIQFNATPTFAMAINQYRLGDRFYIEDFLVS